MQMMRRLYLLQLMLLAAIPAYAGSAGVSSVSAVGMTVSDMDRSIKFYSGLTFRKVSDTGMRAGTGPGVEFLEYLAPRDGRRRPDDSKPNDILYWNTVLVTSDVECLVSELRAEHTHFLSAKVVVLSKGKKDSGKAVLVADPDGHGVLLIETAGAS
jgi:catechol 2,3-dioxygenase-like lactoylglutathione lyase family enzyme